MAIPSNIIDDINLPIEELADAHKYWLKKYMDS